MNRLFLLGATGYVGGDALHVIANACPDLEITALVRNSDKGATVAAQYPKVRLVYGDLDNADLLKKEASHADIVLQIADCDHVACAEALIAGLATQDKKTYFIHTSGAGILCFPDIAAGTFGIMREKVFDDWDGIDEVTSLPDAAVHRNVDKIILGAHAASGGNIDTTIVCPPCIYGPGRGPGNQRSMQVEGYVKATLERSKGFLVEEGANIWNQVHVQDLSELFVALIKAALSPNGGKATWNDKGYYFAENGEFAWGDIAREIARCAFDKKLINSNELDTLDKDGANKLIAMGGYLWGFNSRGRAIRARKLLDWKPTQKSALDLLPEIIDAEAKALGRLKTHAEEAAEGRILR
ncbi:hypothetical protein IAQ61_011633 [Plenodomus lingam]|uniref:uncharacterized protein n=1 Tax=Leptosphaeria maculans TaxID=5022 RepID=UPI00332F44EB|nr:hypothetical protein IAQ61_011633 [Plenodomus lingam]